MAALNNFVNPEDRRKKSNEKIKQMGIACLETLPMIEDSTSVSLKTTNEICSRAIACLLSIQLACDIAENNDYEESKAMMSRLLKEYNVENSLLPKEKCLFDQEYSQQDAIDVVWTYEAYWSLVWALGLIENDELETPDSICNCEKAIKLVSECKSFDEFTAKCKIRDIEEILDMLDLYYRYHWACVENSLNPNTEIGVLNHDVVVERRRGLEWLISEESDWNYISLDT